MPKYSHQCAIAFDVKSKKEDGSDITPAMFKKALLERIEGLSQANKAEWQETVEILDTDEDDD